MEGSGRSRRVLSRVALVAVVAFLSSCSLWRGAGIPAPARPLGGSAPAADYLAYARSLKFNTNDLVSARTLHDTAGSLVRVKISPEKRLVTTSDSAFRVGRIIARIQTDGGVSPYRTPVGQSFLWVWLEGDTYRAKVITDDPLSGAGGSILDVGAFHHVGLSRSVPLTSFCVSVDAAVAGTCCRCASGCWNVWSTYVTKERVAELLRALFRFL